MAIDRMGSSSGMFGGGNSTPYPSPSPSTFLPNPSGFSSSYYNNYGKEPWYLSQSAVTSGRGGRTPQMFSPSAYPNYEGIKENFIDKTYDPAKYAPPKPSGTIPMIRATPQSVLGNNYFQTPGYQLLFGSGPAQMDPRLSPTDRFVHSPGYQYAVDEALRGVNRGSAAQGLLESGATQRDLLNTSMGMGLQDYYNWWDRLSGNYENYQNRLASLASAGMNNTGNDMAFNLGQSQGNTSMNKGNTLASLYGNQGSAGLGAYMNTGAGMASNTMQGLSIQAQIDAANAASKGSGGGGGMEMAGQALGMLGGLF